MIEELEKNKKNAIEFYKLAFEGNPLKAVELYVGNEYIQHNPLVGDGKQPFIEYFEKMGKEYSDKTIEFVREVAEDNLVALSIHIRNGPEMKSMLQWTFSDLMKTVK